MIYLPITKKELDKLVKKGFLTIKMPEDNNLETDMIIIEVDEENVK